MRIAQWKNCRLPKMCCFSISEEQYTKQEYGQPVYVQSKLFHLHRTTLGPKNLDHGSLFGCHFQKCPEHAGNWSVAPVKETAPDANAIMQTWTVHHYASATSNKLYITMRVQQVTNKEHNTQNHTTVTALLLKDGELCVTRFFVNNNKLWWALNFVALKRNRPFSGELLPKVNILMHNLKKNHGIICAWTL